MKENNRLINTLFSKYRALFLSITAFLLLIGALLGLNLYSSLQVGEGTATINASAYMRDLNQAITRDLFNLRLSYGEDPNTPHMTATINRLQSNINLYDQNLTALANGGTLIDADNDKVEIAPGSLEESSQFINQLENEWSTLKPLISEYLRTARTIEASLTALDLAVNQSQSSSIALAENTNKIATQIKNNAYKQAEFLTYLQLFGILAIIVYFLVFILFVLRRLLRADSETEEARQETIEIMQTIQEGLFLVNENLQIGQQTSGKLETLFPEQTFSGEQMENVLAGLVDTKNIDNTRRFIKQLFNERIDEQLIEDLNPLRRVVVHHTEGDKPKLSYMRFIFTRVWEEDHIKRVLVSVTDITQSVELEKRLELERKHNERQTELLIKILQISPPLLTSFLRTAQNITGHINNILRRPDNNRGDLKSKARDIFRDIHSFKGESAALGLDHFVDNCETIEDHLKDLQSNDKITGNDFMPITIALDDIIENIQSIENICTNMTHIIGNNNHHSPADTDSEIKAYYEKFAQEVAERNGKSVTLDIKDYDFQDMDNHTHDQIKEIIIQLIRNAVTHGIETASDRQSLNKNPTGQLILKLRRDQNDDCYLLNFKDDGAGIDYDALKSKLKQQQPYADAPEQIDHMQPNELNRFIFVSGLSTAKNNNKDAGRGVGMDVIKDRLFALKGQISLRSQPKHGTQFSIRIPRTQSGA